MLSESDIDLIRSTREEVRKNRTLTVTLVGENIIEKNPITGEEVVVPFEEDVVAVVTEISVRTAVDRYLNEGIEVRTGDIIVDISYEDIPGNINNESLSDIVYGGLVYTVVSTDSLGLGGYNRVEVIGRR